MDYQEILAKYGITPELSKEEQLSLLEKAKQKYLRRLNHVFGDEDKEKELNQEMELLEQAMSKMLSEGATLSMDDVEVETRELSQNKMMISSYTEQDIIEMEQSIEEGDWTQEEKCAIALEILIYATQKKQVSRYAKWCEYNANMTGHPLYMNLMFHYYADDAYGDKAANKAFYWLKKGAEAGDEECCYKLAKIYMMKNTPLYNLDNALTYYVKAACEEYPDAYSKAASLFYNKKEYRKSEFCMIEAAKLHVPNSAYTLGLLYNSDENDLGERQLEKAQYWMEQAYQDKANADVCFELGDIYLEVGNIEMGIEVLKRGYEEFESQECFDRLKEYADELEVTGRVRRSVEKTGSIDILYETALITGNAEAEYLMQAENYIENKGEELTLSNAYAMYHYYRRHKKNMEKALYWCRKAAKKGSVKAQMDLAVEYFGKEYYPASVFGLEANIEEVTTQLDKIRNGLSQVSYTSKFHKNSSDKLSDLGTEYVLSTSEDKKFDEQYFYVSIRNMSDYGDGYDQKPYSFFTDIERYVSRAKSYEKVKRNKYLTSDIAKDILLEAKNTKSKILRIPEEYTHIDARAFSFFKGPEYKYIAKIKEIVFPESLLEIGAYAFSGCSSLEKVELPPTLEYVGAGVFCGESKGMFGGVVRNNKTIPQLIIHKDTVYKTKTNSGDLKASFLEGIHSIGELRIEEGIKAFELSWIEGMTGEIRIHSLYIPDSVTTIHAGCQYGRIYEVKNISAPKCLKNEFFCNSFKYSKITYR